MINESFKRAAFLLLFILLWTNVFSQSPKREMRSAWIATVWQLDWPKSTISVTGDEQQINAQKNLMTCILDSLVSANMNSICFQARSRCDAMYKSSYEPWSSDLVQTRGMDPGYDPLAFVVQEAHKRGLEVHVWINPYRFESVAGQWSGQPGDYNKDHPDWVLTHGGASILNPGLPEVRQRITDIINEIITKYDVDGIIFDDYFYLSGTTTEDADTYTKYNPEGLSLADWRRDNVNKMIAQVYGMIQTVKPQVKFGVSPAGIWDVNSSIAASYGLTLPSGIAGGYAYNSIYCDPVAWLKQGTVDYISPQIYWTTGSGSTDYNVLAPWWSYVAMHFGKHFYSSHSISALSAPALSASVRINDSIVPITGISSTEQSIIQENVLPQLRFGATEVGAQIDANRNADKSDAPGSIFYSASKLYKTNGFISYLKQNKFTDKALTPAINWKSTTTPGIVSNISLNGNVLSWSSKGGDMRYAVYAIPAFQVKNPAVFDSSEYLLGVSYTSSYTLKSTDDYSDKVFAVSSLDRYGNESSPVIMGQSALTAGVPALAYPADKSSIISPFTFKWDSISGSTSYILEVASDSAFSNLMCAREIYSNSFSTTNLMPFANGKTYYWRVKAKVLGSDTEFSAARKFDAVIFRINNPVDGTEGISLNPEISWSNAGAGASYQLQISTASSFQSNLMVYTADLKSDVYQLPAGILAGLNNYYLRVKTVIDGVETFTPVIHITTKAVVPDILTFSYPVSGSTVEGSQLNVKWNEEPRANDFRVELCSSNTFAPRSTKIKTINPFVYETYYDGLSTGTYYLRARCEYNAKNSSGAIVTNYTEWSDTIAVNYKLATDIENVYDESGNTYILYHGNERNLMFNLAIDSKVTVQLNSITGILLRKIWHGELKAGKHSLAIPVENLPSGVYLLVIENNGRKEVLRVLR